jgi:DNA-binding transcriptional LysR family regulator
MGEVSAWMLDLQHLKTFMAVAATKNFSRAAELLGYGQPSVTQQIQSLERALGARLFRRVRFARSIALTPAGRRIHEYARRLLELEKETKSAALRQKGPASQEKVPSEPKESPRA